MKLSQVLKLCPDPTALTGEIVILIGAGQGKMMNPKNEFYEELRREKTCELREEH